MDFWLIYMTVYLIALLREVTVGSLSDDGDAG
jgi:hypothetical protein